MSMAAENRKAPAMAREPFVAFVQDEETNGIVSQAAHKAGFPENRVYTDGIDGAIKMLSDMETPELIILDLEAGKDPEILLDRLAEVCDPGTSVIAIGQMNDISLYRKLIGMGLREYLVRPLVEEDLLAAMTPEEEADDKSPDARKEALIDVVLAAKGGAGASTIAVNAAWHYANHHQWKTVVLDLDPYFGTTALQLDLEPGRGFREALENPDRVDDLFLERAMIQIGKHLFLLGSEENLANPIESSEESINRIIDLTRSGFDRIVVDLPQAQLPYAQTLLKKAASVTVVTDMTLGGLRDVLRIKTAIQEMGVKSRVVIVANHAGMSKSGELTQAVFEKNLGLQLAAMIPHQPDLFLKSLEEGKTILGHQKGGKIVAELMRAVSGMSGVVEEQKGGFLSGLFKSKPKKPKEKTKPKPKKKGGK